MRSRAWFSSCVWHLLTGVQHSALTWGSGFLIADLIPTLVYVVLSCTVFGSLSSVWVLVGMAGFLDPCGAMWTFVTRLDVRGPVSVSVWHLVPVIDGMESGLGSEV